MQFKRQLKSGVRKSVYLCLQGREIIEMDKDVKDDLVRRLMENVVNSDDRLSSLPRVKT